MGGWLVQVHPQWPRFVHGLRTIERQNRFLGRQHPRGPNVSTASRIMRNRGEAVRHGFAVEHDALVGESAHRRGDGHDLARPVAPIAAPQPHALAVLVGEMRKRSASAHAASRRRSRAHLRHQRRSVRWDPPRLINRDPNRGIPLPVSKMYGAGGGMSPFWMPHAALD